MKVSVVMAVYNGGKYIRRQLESIMSQTRLPDEIIICDDRSADDTVRIADEYMSDMCMHGSRVEYKIIINEANKGYIENFRYALSVSRGDILFTCDQDDVWERDKVEKMCECFENNSRVQLVASSLRFINAKENVIDRAYVPYGMTAGTNELVKIGFDRILEKNYFPGCTMAVSKVAAKKYLDSVHSNIPHDWSMALIAAADDGLYWYNRILLNYRIHGDNTLGLAAADSKLNYIRRTVATWPDYCYELCDRIRYIRKTLELSAAYKDYFDAMEEFAGYRSEVITGKFKVGSFAKECLIYNRKLARKIDRRGIILDFIYIFLTTKKQ